MCEAGSRATFDVFVLSQLYHLYLFPLKRPSFTRVPNPLTSSGTIASGRRHQTFAYRDVKSTV